MGVFGQNGERNAAMFTSNKLVFTFGFFMSVPFLVKSSSAVTDKNARRAASRQMAKF